MTRRNQRTCCEYAHVLGQGHCVCHSEYALVCETDIVFFSKIFLFDESGRGIYVASHQLWFVAHLVLLCFQASAFEPGCSMSHKLLHVSDCQF